MVVEKRAYVTIDGKAFDDRKSAEEYEKDILNNVKFFKVLYSPDLTEGRGLTEAGLVLVHAHRSHKEFAEWYCYKYLGSKVQFVMGVFGSNAIMPGWIVTEIEPGSESKLPVLAKIEEKFVKHKLWGDSIQNERG